MEEPSRTLDVALIVRWDPGTLFRAHEYFGTQGELLKREIVVKSSITLTGYA